MRYTLNTLGGIVCLFFCCISIVIEKRVTNEALFLFIMAFGLFNEAKK